jgi:hypothetical protein
MGELKMLFPVGVWASVLLVVYCKADVRGLV